MSPMNSRRTPYSLRDGDGNPPRAPVVHFGNADPQFAASQCRARAGRVARTPETHDARESSVAAFNEVEAGFARPPRRLLARDEQAVALRDEVNRLGGHAWQIGDDLQRVIGLVDVDWRRAFAGE